MNFKKIIETLEDNVYLQFLIGAIVIAGLLYKFPILIEVFGTW